jgi:hypothetical protein
MFHEVVRDTILRVRILVSRDVLQGERSALMQDALHVLRARTCNPTNRKVLIPRWQGLGESAPHLMTCIPVPLEAVVKDEVSGRRLALPSLSKENYAFGRAPPKFVPFVSLGEGRAETLHRQRRGGFHIAQAVFTAAVFLLASS